MLLVFPNYLFFKVIEKYLLFKIALKIANYRSNTFKVIVKIEGYTAD